MAVTTAPGTTAPGTTATTPQYKGVDGTGEFGCKVLEPDVPVSPSVVDVLHVNRPHPRYLLRK